MKAGFSLLELIFAIVILGIVASFAVPKYMDTKDSALVSTIKRDVSTATNAIRSYYLLNQKIDDINDAMEVNSLNWDSTTTKITDKNGCLSLEVVTTDSNKKELVLAINSDKDSNICKKIQGSELKAEKYELY